MKAVGPFRVGGRKKKKLNRRQFLEVGTLGVAAAILPALSSRAFMSIPVLRIAFLHLAPCPGEVAANRRMIENAVTTAAGLGAAWILTPELCITGYEFAEQVGTEWIVPSPDPWMKDFCQLVARLRVTVFLSHPERDQQTTQLYNSLFVIGADGAILGKHHKFNTLRVGAEAWSGPGEQIAPIRIPPLTSVGLLICADAYSPRIARSLRAQGAQLLVSSAAWGPGLHGPAGEWERCTRDTGLSLLVCNRTGPDRSLDFTGAESVIIKDGKRLLSFHSPRSAIFLIEWNLQTQSLATTEYQTIDL